MVKLNYGKYRIPDTLKRIIALQEQLNQRGFLQYGDLLGYYFSLEGLDSRYLNTPLDVIAFARPGADGIGVVNQKDEEKSHQLMKFTMQQTLKLEDVQRFFETTSFESKLVFLRDVQSKGLIYDNDEVKRYLKEQLLLMNLNYEAVRLSEGGISWEYLSVYHNYVKNYRKVQMFIYYQSYVTIWFTV